MFIPGIKFRPCNYDEFIYEFLMSRAEGISKIDNFVKKIKEDVREKGKGERERK